MKRMVGIALMVTLAAPVLAQHSVKMTSRNGNTQIMTHGEMSYGSGSSTRSLLSSAGSGRYILYGRLPMVYKILGLTDEQMKAVEGICAEAKEATMELYKTRRREGQRKSREEYQKMYAERREKQDALLARFETRIRDVLTADQKALLDRIKALAEELSAEDKKIAEQARLAREKLSDEYEGKLTAILSPEQLKKLEEMTEAAKQRREGRNHR